MTTSLDLSGRVALVTGAGQGIGRAIARRLALHGAHVAVNDIDPTSAAATADDIASLGPGTTSIAADVSSAAEVDRMISRVYNQHGRLDILVNNAGISEYRPLLDCDEDAWDRHLDIMAKGTFLCMRRVAPIMLEQRWGSIVNLGSYVAQINCATKYFGPYCAAKFGIVGLTQVAAQEWAPDVRVNAVGPGDVETEMMEREWAQEGQLRQIDAAAVKEEYRTRLLLGTLQTPDDIAGVVTFLCSPLASQITGLHLVASGGLPYTAGNTGASGDVASM